LQFVALLSEFSPIWQANLTLSPPRREFMRKILLTATTAFVIGGIATGAVMSQAQPAPPPGHEFDGAPQHPGMMGWRHHHLMRDGMTHRDFDLRALALIYRQDDRQLGPADVQKIAEAFLLWNGNHTWKVSDPAPAADGTIGFSLTTADGSVVAKFTMEPHSGRIQRVG
jgi:hypothetical protein